MDFLRVHNYWRSSAYTLLIIVLKIKHMKRRIESTDAHRFTQMIRKKIEVFFFPLGISTQGKRHEPPAGKCSLPR